MSFTVGDPTASGTLVTQGGQGDGWGLFLFDGRATFIYKTSSLPGNTWRVNAAEPLSPGEHVVRLHVTPQSMMPGAPALISLEIDGGAAATGRVDSTVPNTFSLEGVGIGRDFGTALLDDYVLPFRFLGTMGAVKIWYERSDW